LESDLWRTPGYVRENGVVTWTDAAREVGASVSLARGFLPGKAERTAAREVASEEATLRH
jgi:hypothetical protein